MTERKYALTKITPGDYLCGANDGKTIWRFDTYFDGKAWGLADAEYEERKFWRASWRPASDLSVKIENDEDYFGFLEEGWHEYAGSLDTRAEAIEVMLTFSEKVAEEAEL